MALRPQKPLRSKKLSDRSRGLPQFDITTLLPLALMIATSDFPEGEKREIYQNLASYVVPRAICELTQKNCKHPINPTLGGPTPGVSRPGPQRRSAAQPRGVSDAICELGVELRP